MPEITDYLSRTPALAEKIVKRLTETGKWIATAESCTAGLAASFIASVPGASKVFWGAFITYTADAKTKLLGVDEGLIREYGEVSRPVALAMAEGALEKSGASMAFSITGLAGPDNDAAGTPVGTVWVGLAGFEGKTFGRLQPEAKLFHFTGSRNEVREAASAAALEEVLERILTGNIDKDEVLV